LVSLKDDGPLEKGKAPIVKRTQGWRENLKKQVELLIDKYEDNEDFWEDWAATRQRRGDPKKEMKRQEEEERREEQEERRRSEPPAPRHTPPPQQPQTYQREVPLEKLRGDATPKQIGFIRAMLNNVDGHDEWRELGLDDITGFDHIPNRAQMDTLSKRDASRLIDELIRAGKRPQYGRRYADIDLSEVIIGID
jgi:hypothetical protein